MTGHHHPDYDYDYDYDGMPLSSPDSSAARRQLRRSDVRDVPDRVVRDQFRAAALTQSATVEESLLERIMTDDDEESRENHNDGKGAEDSGRAGTGAGRQLAAKAIVEIQRRDCGVQTDITGISQGGTGVGLRRRHRRHQRQSAVDLVDAGPPLQAQISSSTENSSTGLSPAVLAAPYHRSTSSPPPPAFASAVHCLRGPLPSSGPRELGEPVVSRSPYGSRRPGCGYHVDADDDDCEGDETELNSDLDDLLGRATPVELLYSTDIATPVPSLQGQAQLQQRAGSGDQLKSATTTSWNGGRREDRSRRRPPQLSQNSTSGGGGVGVNQSAVRRPTTLKSGCLQQQLPLPHPGPPVMAMPSTIVGFRPISLLELQPQPQQQEVHETRLSRPR